MSSKKISNKKIIVLILAGILLMCSAAISEDAHEHVWGEWTEAETGGHIAFCVAEDGASKTASHYTASVKIGDITYRVCLMCGDYGEETLPLIADAAAEPVNANPGTQRGNLVVRGKAHPFENDPSVVLAFTVCYERDGGLATFKNQSRVSFSLGDVELPEGVRLIRVQSSAGDDSVQNPETWIEMSYELQDGVFSFNTKTPTVYLLIAD